MMIAEPLDQSLILLLRYFCPDTGRTIIEMQPVLEKLYTILLGNADEKIYHVEKNK